MVHGFPAVSLALMRLLCASAGWWPVVAGVSGSALCFQILSYQFYTNCVLLHHGQMFQ
jgi:hypothetical protein